MYACIYIYVSTCDKHKYCATCFEILLVVFHMAWKFVGTSVQLSSMWVQDNVIKYTQKGCDALFCCSNIGWLVRNRIRNVANICTHAHTCHVPRCMCIHTIVCVCVLYAFSRVAVGMICSCTELTDACSCRKFSPLVCALQYLATPDTVLGLFDDDKTAAAKLVDNAYPLHWALRPTWYPRHHQLHVIEALLEVFPSAATVPFPFEAQKEGEQDVAAGVFFVHEKKRHAHAFVFTVATFIFKHSSVHVHVCIIARARAYAAPAAADDEIRERSLGAYLVNVCVCICATLRRTQRARR